MNIERFFRAKVLLAAALIILATASLLTAGSAIQGRVAGIQGGRVKIAYEGPYAPNIGDPIEIGFKIGDDFISVEGKWKIVEVGPEFVWAEVQGGGGGEPSLGYIAVIDSTNPQSRSGLPTSATEASGSVTSRYDQDKQNTDVSIPPFVYEYGYDRPGGEYLAHYADVSNPQDCLDLCSGNADCVAFTWVQPNIQGPTGMCWLKRSLSKKVSLDCCVSGVVKAVSEDLCQWRETGNTYTCFCQNSKTKKWYQTNPSACLGLNPCLK
jgi:hypothetical protein